MSYPTTPRSATTLVKGVLRHLDGIRAVNSHQQADCLSTTVHLDGTDADHRTALHYLRGAFDDCEVTGHLSTRFIGIAYRAPGAGRLALDDAYEMHRADENAERSYRAARRVDLRRWLSPTYENASPVDAWTKARRRRQMQNRLAVLDAEVCTNVEHDRFWFGSERGEDIEAHVAEHLAELHSK